jgi:SagB-type dehydrogenase family enzyme
MNAVPVQRLLVIGAIMELAAGNAAPRSRQSAGDRAFREMYQLRPDASLVSRDDGSIVLQQHHFEGRIAAPTAGRRAMLLRLAGQWADEAELSRVIAAAEGEHGLMRGQLLLRRLELHSWLSRRLQVGERPLLDVIPVALGSGSAPRRTRPVADVRYELSRFAALSADAGLVAQAPFSPVAIAIRDPRVAGILVPAAASGCTVSELARLAGVDLQAAAAVLDALLTARILVSAAERRAESCEPPKAVWSSHELALHHRARSGWHALPTGGTFRFQGMFPSEPLGRESAEPSGPSAVYDLPVPDLEKISQSEPSLTDVVTSRHSLRQYDDARPITIGQLAEFLYRVQHTSTLRDTDDGQGVGRRPYPAGGQLCELEVYPLVSRCSGLDEGLYRYDSVAHRLIRLAPAHGAARRMLGHACDTAMLTAPPQVLLVITARVQRMLWKYEGIGYELALKNSGVLTELMYLVATAMGLAPCALGSGDSAAFALLSGIDPLVEPYIADFALGSRAAS